MRYVMKQKLFSFNDKYYVKDETGREVCYIDGKLFSIANQLSFKNMANQEIASIKEKLFAWGPTYEIYRGGQLFAVVKKKLFTLLNCKFTIDVPGPNDLEATGDFLDHRYTFTRQGVPVALVSKEWFTWEETYGVDVMDGEDPVIILASTVVIDLACHSGHRGSGAGLLADGIETLFD